MKFIIGQLAAERSHAVSAVGNLTIDLALSFKLELALAEAWNLQPLVRYLAFTFGTVADSAVLAEERSLISFALGDRITFCFGAETGG